MRTKIILNIQFFLLMVYGLPSKKEKLSFKCGVDSDQSFSKFLYVTPKKEKILFLIIED